MKYSDNDEDYRTSATSLLLWLALAGKLNGEPLLPFLQRLEVVFRLPEPTRLEVPTPYGHVPMHYPAMQAFSTLPNLRELSVDVRFEDMYSHVPCRGGFAALESFCLTRGSLPDIEEALQMVASSHLRRLQITILMSVDAQRLTTFLDGLRHAAIGITSLWLHLDCFVHTTTPLGQNSLGLYSHSTVLRN